MIGMCVFVLLGMALCPAQNKQVPDTIKESGEGKSGTKVGDRLRHF